MTKQFATILAIMFMAVACVGCHTGGKQVSIDTSFLSELQRQPSLEQWEKHDSELLYLVSQNYPDAILAAQRVIPVVKRADIVYPELSWLALAVYSQVDLRGVERLSMEDQKITIQYYDSLKPLDWPTVREDFIKQSHLIVEMR